jgi:DNA-binding transcriptional regulator YhcF (GntR family)
LGVRALASALRVEPNAIATALRELRAAGRIRKHGEKRATTYSIV